MGQTASSLLYLGDSGAIGVERSGRDVGGQRREPKQPRARGRQEPQPLRQHLRFLLGSVKYVSERNSRVYKSIYCDERARHEKVSRNLLIDRAVPIFISSLISQH